MLPGIMIFYGFNCKMGGLFMNFHKMNGSFDPGSTKNAIPFGENCKKSLFFQSYFLEQRNEPWVRTKTVP